MLMRANRICKSLGQSCSAAMGVGEAEMDVDHLQRLSYFPSSISSCNIDHSTSYQVTQKAKDKPT